MDFQVTVTDEQGARILTAFSTSKIEDDMSVTYTDATVEQVDEEIKDWLKSRVKAVETRQTAQEVHDSIDNEEW